MSWLIEKIKKFVLNNLPGSISTRSINKEHSIDQLVIKYQLNQTDWSLFHSIDWKQFSIDWNSWNLNFPEFFWSNFQRFFMNKQPSNEHNRLSLISKLNFIDAIALKFDFTYLTSNLNNIITSISVLSKNNFNDQAEN